MRRTPAAHCVRHKENAPNTLSSQLQQQLNSA
jgi:hypothetical protein